MRIFEASDYKVYLRKELESERFGRGVRARLAEFIKVQPSFISLVLSGEQDFSTEHGIKIADFLELDADETRYLILMINHDRAGSHSLKQHYQRELAELKKKNSEIKTRINSEKKELSPLDLHEYYGAWYHTAVHMCVRIPEYKGDPSLIAEALKLDLKQVKQSLALLLRIGFVRRVGEKYSVVESRFHLGDQSSMLRVHHMNWRLASMRALDDLGSDGLHYSSIVSIDRSSYETIRKLLLEVVEKKDVLIKEAKDQLVCSMSFDLFKLTN